MSSLTTIFRYRVSEKGVVAERDNLRRPFVFNSISKFVLKQKLNDVRVVVLSVRKTDVDINDIYFEREVFIAKYGFGGIITAVKDDGVFYHVTVSDRLWEFSRLFFRSNVGGTVFDYNDEIQINFPFAKFEDDDYWLIHGNQPDEISTVDVLIVVAIPLVVKRFVNKFAVDLYALPNGSFINANKIDVSFSARDNNNLYFIVNRNLSIYNTFIKIREVESGGIEKVADEITNVNQLSPDYASLDFVIPVPNVDEANFFHSSNKLKVGFKTMVNQMNEDLNPNKYRKTFKVGNIENGDFKLTYDVKHKKLLEIMKLFAKYGIVDFWLEDDTIHVGKKGKLVEVDESDNRLFNIVSTFDLNKYGNSIIIHGKGNVQRSMSKEDDTFGKKYEQVISNNDLPLETVESILQRSLDELSTVSPDVTLKLNKTIVDKYSFETGDVIKIFANDITQNVKGFYRIIQLNATDDQYSLKLQFSKDGVFIPRFVDSLDVLETLLQRVQALDISSG